MIEDLAAMEPRNGQFNFLLVLTFIALIGENVYRAEGTDIL